MPINAKLYAAVLILLGLRVFVLAFSDWRSADPTKLVCFFILAVVFSGLGAVIPAMSRNISFVFLFVMFGVVDFSLPETVLIGVSSVLAGSLMAKRFRNEPLQLTLDTCVTATAAACTYAIYHASFLGGSSLEVPVRIALASTILFVFSTFPIAAMMSLAERESLLRNWQQTHFGTYPYYLLAGGLAWLYGFAARSFGWQSSLLVLPLLYVCYRMYRMYLEHRDRSRTHAEQVAELHMRTIEALALAIEAKDDTTHDHLKRVQVYATEVGRDLGMGDDDIEALRAAAVLHDIGKLAVPEYIISKPGKLTPEEFEKMKIHPIVGAEILEHVQFPYPVVPIVRAHHEKWNGTGYPAGLRGEEIPLGARILSAVDMLDALASDRQYRRALPLDEAMEKVGAESGKSFDPRVIDVLQQRYVELEQMAQEHCKQRKSIKLSVNVRVSRGLAPATGFEMHHAAGAHNEQAPAGGDFLSLMADARRDLLGLFDGSLALDGQQSVAETLAILSVRLKHIVPFDAIAVYFVRDDKLVPEFVSGDNYRLFSSLQIPIGQGLSGWVAENHKPILNGNPSVEPGYLNDPNVFSTMRSALAVPLEGSHAVIGVLTLYAEGRDAFNRNHQRLLENLAPKLGLCVENLVKQNERASLASGISASTPSENRAVMATIVAEIERCGRMGTPLALVVCDIQGLPLVRSRAGSEETDRLVRSLASALKEQCREFDTLARTGASEFLLVLPGMNELGVSHKLRKIMNVALSSGGESLSLAVGTAYYPEDGADPEALIAAADRRLLGSRLKGEGASPLPPSPGSNWVQ